MKSLVLATELIKKSFGEKIVGNMYFYGITGGSDSVNYLNYLGKWGLLRDKVLGKFTKTDGSELHILPEWMEEAEKYASLYEDKTGRRANVYEWTEPL